MYIHVLCTGFIFCTLRTFHTGFIICTFHAFFKGSKIVSEYDQEIPQSQTADNPMALRGRTTQPSQDTRKTN